MLLGKKKKSRSSFLSFRIGNKTVLIVELRRRRINTKKHSGILSLEKWMSSLFKQLLSRLPLFSPHLQNIFSLLEIIHFFSLKVFLRSTSFIAEKSGLAHFLCAACVAREKKILSTPGFIDWSYRCYAIWESWFGEWREREDRQQQKVYSKAQNVFKAGRLAWLASPFLGMMAAAAAFINEGVTLVYS